MATKKQHSVPIHLSIEAPTPATVERAHGNLQRWRERSAERKRRRLVSARHCRALAHELRRTATPTRPPSRFDIAPVLCDRVAAVRDELLDVVTALERGHDPDPGCVALIHELLRDGASPLYKPSVPAADLHAALRRAHAGLAAQPPA
jgi:hypothetical protein